LENNFHRVVSILIRNESQEISFDERARRNETEYKLLYFFLSAGLFRSDSREYETVGSSQSKYVIAYKFMNPMTYSREKSFVLGIKPFGVETAVGDISAHFRY